MTAHHDDSYCLFVAVDAIVFTVIERQLCVLLIKNKFPPYEDRFALPGGRMHNNETPEHAVARELREETGVADVFLKPYRAYGAVDRDPRSRVVSLAYLAFIDSERFTLRASDDAKSSDWVPVADIGQLAYDHNTILQDALDALRFEIQTTTIAAQLLPEKFSLSELRALYEDVLGRELDKRNFRKRVLELDFLVETGEQRRSGAHRPAMLYQFRSREYKPLKEAVRVFM
jgi:8-oxo-dGTP diphosphatase